MTKEREALNLSLEALYPISHNATDDPRGQADKAISLIKAALPQPSDSVEQEPVATVQCINGVTIGYLDVMQPVGTKLYTSQQKRQPLTNEQIEDIGFNLLPTVAQKDFVEFARAIEAAHGIKELNT